ncbi:MAG TPA: hypothetical protein VF180_08240 [Acidimicrobiia bacterium]
MTRAVPWCATCERFLSPPTVTPEGRCPSCGRPVEPGGAHASGDTPERTPRTEGEPAGEEELGPIPLHLKIMGVALVVYLGWRFFQGVEWIIHRF